MDEVDAEGEHGVVNRIAVWDDRETAFQARAQSDAGSVGLFGLSGVALGGAAGGDSRQAAGSGAS